MLSLSFSLISICLSLSRTRCLAKSLSLSLSLSRARSISFSLALALSRSLSLSLALSRSLALSLALSLSRARFLSLSARRDRHAYADNGKRCKDTGTYVSAQTYSRTVSHTFSLTPPTHTQVQCRNGTLDAFATSSAFSSPVQSVFPANLSLLQRQPNRVETRREVQTRRCAFQTDTRFVFPLNSPGVHCLSQL